MQSFQLVGTLLLAFSVVALAQTNPPPADVFTLTNFGISKNGAEVVPQSSVTNRVLGLAVDNHNGYYYSGCWGCGKIERFPIGSTVRDEITVDIGTVGHMSILALDLTNNFVFFSDGDDLRRADIMNGPNSRLEDYGYIHPVIAMEVDSVNMRVIVSHTTSIEIYTYTNDANSVSLQTTHTASNAHRMLALHPVDRDTLFISNSDHILKMDLSDGSHVVWATGHGMVCCMGFLTVDMVNEELLVWDNKLTAIDLNDPNNGRLIDYGSTDKPLAIAGCDNGYLERNEVCDDGPGSNTCTFNCNGPPDLACTSNYGLDCTCASAVAGSGEVDVATLSLTADDRTGDLSLTAGGAHALAGRTVTRTEVTVQSGGATCLKKLSRANYDCSGSSGCGDCTAGLTLAALRAHCGADLETETVDGETVLRVDAVMYYEDALTDVFGGVVGTAQHQSGSTVYIRVGSGQVSVKGAATGGITAFDVQVSSTSITPSTGDADTNAEMDVTMLVTMNKDSTIGGTAQVVVASTTPAAVFTTASVTSEPASLGCTATRCASQLTVQLVSDVAGCDFSGTFTVTLVLDGESREIDVSIAGVAGTDACSASTVGASGTAAGVVGDVTATSTNILGSAGGATSLAWASSAQLLDGSNQPDGTDINSDLVEIHMELQPTSGAGSTCDTSVAGVKVYSADGSTTLLTKASDGSNMVSVAAVNDDRDTVTLDVTTEDLLELQKLDTSGSDTQFDSLKATYTAQLCVVVTRSAQVGVQLPTRRLRSAGAVAVRRLPGAVDVETVAAGATGTANLVVAAPGDDTSITASLLLRAKAGSGDSLDATARAAVSKVVVGRLADVLNLGQRSIHVNGVTQEASPAGLNMVRVSFTLVLPAMYDAHVAFDRLQGAIDSVNGAASSSFADDLNMDLLTGSHTGNLEVVSGSASRDVDALTPTESTVQPWMLAAGGAVVVVAAAVVVAWCHAHKTSKGPKGNSNSKIRTIKVNSPRGTQDGKPKTGLNGSSGTVGSWTSVAPSPAGGSTSVNPTAVGGSGLLI